MLPKYFYFKVVTTIACNKGVDSVDQRSDQTACLVKSNLDQHRPQKQLGSSIVKVEKVLLQMFFVAEFGQALHFPQSFKIPSSIDV